MNVEKVIQYMDYCYNSTINISDFRERIRLLLGSMPLSVLEKIMTKHNIIETLAPRARILEFYDNKCVNDNDWKDIYPSLKQCVKD